MKAQDTEHEQVAAAISEATGIPKEAIFSSEVLGVMGLVAALYAWQHLQLCLRGLETPREVWCRTCLQWYPDIIPCKHQLRRP